jgi:phosphatidylglycerophosphate synthase
MRQFFITLFTPVARRMAGVNPNFLTMLSLIIGILAGASFVYTRQNPRFFLLAGVFIMISGAADSLDGIIARMYNRTTKKGDFLDHFCDRLIDIAILMGLSFSRGAHMILGFSLSLLVLLHSYLGTQIEATLGKRSYEGTGKAEFFVAFILFSIIAAIFPDPSLEIAGEKIVLADIFMSILLIATLISLIQRFSRGLKACSQQDKK